MPPEDSVLSQLNKDFPSEEDQQSTDDVFGETAPAAKVGDELPEDMKNRHIRRLEAKLERERIANIEFAARDTARSEYEKFQTTTKELTPSDKLLTLYGDNENGRKAALLHQQLIEEAVERARDEAVEQFSNVQRSETQEVQKAGQEIEDSLETIEDTYNVDLSGSTDQSRQVRNSFLDLVGRLSPKDAEGNILQYADFDTAWELFQARMQRPASRNKDMAARGLARSGSETTQPSQNLEAEKYLREQGII